MRLLLVLTSLLGVAWADVPRCSNDQAPGDATALSGGALKLHGELAKQLKGRSTLAAAPSQMSFCVTSTAGFLGNNWLNATTIGPIDTHLAYGLMAYVTGIQRFAAQPDLRRGGTADLNGAWLVGCAYARAHTRAARVDFLAPLLEAHTGPRGNSAAWFAMISRGYAECRVGAIQ